MIEEELAARIGAQNLQSLRTILEIPRENLWNNDGLHRDF